MNRNRFLACIDRCPIQGMFLTFTKDGIPGLRRFRKLCQDTGARMGPRYYPIVDKILASDDWRQDYNRTITVAEMCSIGPDDLGPLARHIEKIECGDRGVSALMAPQKKLRKEAAKEIIKAILTEELRQEVKFNDAIIEGNYAEFSSLPAVEFCVFLDKNDEKILSVIIDGWSGQIAIDMVWMAVQYTEPQKFIDLIKQCLYEAIERKRKGSYVFT
jgi:hypothetical protein